MDANSGLIVRADSGISGPGDLGGKVVSAGSGTPQINQLNLAAEEHGISHDGDIKTYDDDAVADQAMRAGRVDAYASTLVSLLEFAKTDDGFQVIPFTSTRWSQEFTNMAFRKEDEDLRGAINDLIAEMKADGTLAALQEKWFGPSFVDILPMVSRANGSPTCAASPGPSGRPGILPSLEGDRDRTACRRSTEMLSSIFFEI